MDHEAILRDGYHKLLPALWMPKERRKALLMHESLYCVGVPRGGCPLYVQHPVVLGSIPLGPFEFFRSATDTFPGQKVAPRGYFVPCCCGPLSSLGVLTSSTLGTRCKHCQLPFSEHREYDRAAKQQILNCIGAFRLQISRLSVPNPVELRPLPRIFLRTMSVSNSTTPILGPRSGQKAMLKD